MSQKEVAKATGLSRYTLIKLEKGQEGSPASVQALAEYYGVNPLSICDLKDVVRKEYLPKSAEDAIEICKLVSNYAN